MKRLLTIAALVLIAGPAVRGIHAQMIARRFVPVTAAKLQKPTNSDWLIMKSRSNPFVCPKPFWWPQQNYRGHSSARYDKEDSRMFGSPEPGSTGCPCGP